MTKTDHKIVQGLKEAVEYARGNAEGARTTVSGPAPAEDVYALLKARLRARLVVTTHHGERDEVHGAAITDASIKEAASDIAALIRRQQAEIARLTQNDELQMQRAIAAEARLERCEAALREIAALKAEDMPHGDTHLAAVIARAALREQEQP